MKSIKAFTLTEVLITITIIAILAAIAIPLTSSIVRNSKAKTDDANVKIFQTAIDKSVAAGGNYPIDKASILSILKKYANLDVVPAPSTQGKIYVYDTSAHKVSVIDINSVTGLMIQIN